MIRSQISNFIFHRLRLEYRGLKLGSEAHLITIIDYGSGNLRSVSKALDHLGVPNRISDQPADAEFADRLILPGVGAFGACVEGVRSRGFEPAIHAFIATGRPFLGICVGMQILAETSEESPEARGLGVIQGGVPKLGAGLTSEDKIPHMGWNNVDTHGNGGPLFCGIPENSHFYFVHSYYVRPEGKDAGIVASTCHYGQDFPSTIQRDNVFATQFHPEKSQRWGLKLLENFSKL